MNLYTFFNHDIVTFIEYLKEYDFKTRTMLNSLVTRLNSHSVYTYHHYNNGINRVRNHIPQLIQQLQYSYNVKIINIVKHLLDEINSTHKLIKTKENVFRCIHALNEVPAFEITPDGGITLYHTDIKSTKAIYGWLGTVIDVDSYKVDYLEDNFYVYNTFELLTTEGVAGRFNYNAYEDTYELVCCPFGGAINSSFRSFVELVEYISIYFLGADKVFTLDLTYGQEGIYTFNNKQKRAYKLKSKHAQVALRLIKALEVIHKPSIDVYEYLRTPSALRVPSILAKYEKIYGSMDNIVELIKR